MAHNSNPTCKNAIFSYYCAAGYATTACNRCIFSDLDVMGNLNQIVNNNTTFNDGIAQGSPVDGGAGTDLNTIADFDAAQLVNFYPMTSIVGKTKAVATDHCPAVNADQVADTDALIKGDIGSQTTIFSDKDIGTDATSGTNGGSRPDLGTCADGNMRADGGGFVYSGTVVDNCCWMNTFGQGSYRVEQFGYPGIAKIGICHDQLIAGIVSRLRRVQNDCTGAGGCQILLIRLAGKEGELALASLLKGIQAANNTVGIALQFRAQVVGKLFKSVLLPHFLPLALFCFFIEPFRELGSQIEAGFSNQYSIGTQ